LEIAYFDQQREQLDPDRTVADTVNDGNDTVSVHGVARHVIGYLADFLFPRERAVSPVKLLSGGERNRLMLARLFARPANVVVMDEPTNDLDIETLDLLEEVINEFEGTVLLVSHDRVFLDRIVTSTLAFEGGGQVVEYVGGYDDYLRQSESVVRGAGSVVRDPAADRDRSSTPVAARIADRAARTPDPGSPQRKKLTFNEVRELESLPSRIESLESEQRELQRESESADFYKASAERIREVLARIDTIGAELETALARWMDLEERQR
jgi:ATP-binding cassette subfamily F protein uup